MQKSPVIHILPTYTQVIFSPQVYFAPSDICYMHCVTIRFVYARVF